MLQMCNASAVVGVVAELDEEKMPGIHVSAIENIIISQCREVSADEKHEVRDKVNEALRPLGFETTLLVIRRANSIALYFVCLTLSAVISLRGQWRSGQLRDIVKKFFTLLSTTSRTVPVKRLTWPVTDYEQCLDFFHSVQGKAFSCFLCTLINWLNWTVFSEYMYHFGDCIPLSSFVY